jgi:hypothetical protein
MDEVIVLQNDMSREGRRRVHVMAALPPTPPQMQTQHLGRGEAGIPEWAEVKVWMDEIRLHHLTATWMAREAMYYIFCREEGGRKHPVVVWAVSPTPNPSPFANTANGEGGKIAVSKAEQAAIIFCAMQEAALVFNGTFGYWPSAAWVRTWPKELKEEEEAFIPLEDGFGMDLFAVSWALEGFVIVGGGLSATHVADTADGGSKPPRLVNQKG